MLVFSQSYGVSEPAALPGHQGQSDREPGERSLQSCTVCTVVSHARN